MILKQVIYNDVTNSVEATWVDNDGVIIKCRSYAGEQMDDLAIDLGNNASTYSTLIATARSRVVPYVPPPPVIPFTVTPFQAKAAMLSAGLLTTVLAIINDPATPALTKLAWDNVTEFTRDSPLLNGLAKHESINLTDVEVDALFIAASQIEI